MAQTFDERGLEVYFSSLSAQLVRRSDVLVAYVHWKLVQNGLKCVGKGEDFVANVHASELMPIGWNSDDFEYCLKYIANGEPYLLKVIVTDTTAFVAFQHAGGANESVSTQIELDRLYAVVDGLDSEDTRRKALDSFIQDSSLRASLSTEISVLSKLTTDSAQKTTANNTSNSSSYVAPKSGGYTSIGTGSFTAQPSRPVSSFSYGRADLDPFAVNSGIESGSGMFFDPLRIGQTQPRQPGYPPGARFDPIAPDFSGFDPDPFSSGRRPPSGGRPQFGGFERKPNFGDFA